MESGIDIQHMLFPLSGEEMRKASDQEKSEHESKIEYHKMELQYAAIMLIGNRFPLCVLAARENAGK